MAKAPTATVLGGRAQRPEAQPDVLDAAIAAVPRTVAAKQVSFAIRNDAGETKPVMIALPADLTHEEALAVVGAVATICQQVIDQQKPVSPLTLVHGTLPPAG